MVVVEILHGAPIEGEQQVEPAVTVNVAPERSGDHADLTQAGGNLVGDVIKAPPAVGEQRASWGQRVLGRQDARADEDIKPPVAIEVRGDRSACADRQRGQRFFGRGSETTVAVVQEEPWLVFRLPGRQTVATFGHEQIVLPVAIGVEEEKRSVVDFWPGH